MDGLSFFEEIAIWLINSWFISGLILFCVETEIGFSILASVSVSEEIDLFELILFLNKFFGIRSAFEEIAFGSLTLIVTSLAIFLFVLIEISLLISGFGFSFSLVNSLE